MNITTAGADLAKNLITVCAQDATGKTVERRDLRREAFLSWPTCERCWSREPGRP